MSAGHYIEPFGVDRLAMGATEFVASEARRRRSRSAWNSIIDVHGGLAVGQYGLALEAAQTTVLLGVQAYLLDNGLFLVSPEFCLEALELCNHEVATEASLLLLEPPTQPRDVPAYTEACESFVRDALGLVPPRFSPGNTDDVSSQEFWDIVTEVETIATAIGRPSPFPAEERPRSLNI